MSMRSLTAKLSPSRDPEPVGSTSTYSTKALPSGLPADLSGPVGPSDSHRCWPIATSTPPSQRTITLLCHRSPKGHFVLASGKMAQGSSLLTARATEDLRSRPPPHFTQSQMENSQKFAPGVFRWHHGRSGKGARRVLRAARKEVRQYATYSCATCCFRVVLDRRGIRRLGFAWIPHRTRPVRPVPRAVLPGRARPRRGAVGALARLLLAPRPDRLLGRSQVAGWQPSACGDHGSVGWLLHPPWAREAQQELSRNGGDAAGRSAHRGGVDHLGRGFTQERSPE